MGTLAVAGLGYLAYKTATRQSFRKDVWKPAGRGSSAAGGGAVTRVTRPRGGVARRGEAIGNQSQTGRTESKLNR